MNGELNRLPITLALLLWPCLIASAQSTGDRCVALHTIKDGKPLEGPKSVSFIDQHNKRSIDTDGGRFCIPKQMAEEPALDMSFTLGTERFYLPRVPIERFGAPWDISFGTT